MNTYPQQHLEDAEKLTGDGYVTLFQIVLKSGGTLYLSPKNTVEWQGNTYESWPIHLTGVSASTDGEESRPKLVLGNPSAVLSPLVRQGEFNRATVTRIRLLRQHLEANAPIARYQTWRVNHVPSLNKGQINMELRTQLDGQFFLVPARMFIPPEFPEVSLS